MQRLPQHGNDSLFALFHSKFRTSDSHASYQIVIEGTSCREKLSPHRKMMGISEGIDSSTVT